MNHPTSSPLVGTETPLSPAPVALEQALEQSHDVKAKVEACAEDLALASDNAKKTIATGATTLPAKQTLDHNQAVESKVQEAAQDLDSVTKTLAQGIDELKLVEVALTSSKTALAETTASLASALAGEERANRRVLARPHNRPAQPSAVRRSPCPSPRACRTPRLDGGRDVSRS